MEELNDLGKYLMSVAMFSLKYNDALGLDETKVSNTLGTIFRNNQEQIKELTAQELALIIVYLSEIKSTYYREYLTIFKKDIIEYVIKNAKSIYEQIRYLNYIETFYLTFFESFELCDIFKEFGLSELEKYLF